MYYWMQKDYDMDTWCREKIENQGASNHVKAKTKAQTYVKRNQRTPESKASPAPHMRFIPSDHSRSRQRPDYPAFPGLVDHAARADWRFHLLPPFGPNSLFFLFFSPSSLFSPIFLPVLSSFVSLLVRGIFPASRPPSAALADSSSFLFPLVRGFLAEEPSSVFKSPLTALRFLLGRPSLDSEREGVGADVEAAPETVVERWEQGLSKVVNDGCARGSPLPAPKVVAGALKDGREDREGETAA
ncbi:hypothetical protein BKA70DRAFT_753375 [Coprinopsis sp. MPI-PUGE-AT-0042]|nr:hypothetical protein BKA70DRAFT_753375 [Coprinopsis sp. MPI-PUGE-AT-0042]